MPFFRSSIFRTECDACGKPFPVNTGGVCERCRRILCAEHLHGSFVRRIAIAVGAPMLCVTCRAGESPEAPDAR
ncbi:MAG: hypothetical protein IPK85_09380 [Gemmatimonadetes bacterium]|nr:hypothetical protein [Gemmatimonadota bacterium]